MNWLGLAVIAGLIILALVSWRAKRPGETLAEATERLLNTDEHKARERERQAGLRGDAEADPPPK